MSGTALPPAVNRRLSRSNSTSSSATTVKYFGAKVGHRKSISQARPTSSDSINQHFSTLDAASLPQRPEQKIVTGRSQNLNINRWSHSTSSSMGAIDGDFLRQISGNAATMKPHRPEPPAITTLPKSSYARQPHEAQVNASPRKSPTRATRISRNNSNEAFRNNGPGMGSGQNSNLTSTPDLDKTISRQDSNDYFGTTILDQSRGANKYGQHVEGIALQFTSGHSRQKRSDQSKLGTTNSSHISLQKQPSHTRRRDRSENNSRDTATGGSISSMRSDQSRRAGHRSPTQKNMLSQALAMANQAVLCDNAQNIQGAIEAYIEACNILEQVMVRSSDNEDRKKLSAIRTTYSTRIAELYDLDNSFDHLDVDKALPEAPTTTRYLDGQDRISFEDPEDMEPPIFVNGDPGQIQLPLRQESLLPQIFGGDAYMSDQQASSSSSMLKPPPPPVMIGSMDKNFMPSPLSPRRSPSAGDDHPTPVTVVQNGHVLSNRASTGSTSWLDTFDEPPSSSQSSRLSSVDFGNRDYELVSAIEAELDAAVDAAYDDLEPEDTPRQTEMMNHFQPQPIPRPMPQQKLATYPSHDNMAPTGRFDPMASEYMDAEAEEEEEMLELMLAQDFLNNPGPAIEKPSTLPRQSDSSGVSARSSGRTWESSNTTATQGTTLSTLAEGPETLPMSTNGVENADSTDAHILRQKQSSPVPPIPQTDKAPLVPLRDRRLSGQSASQLKIETFARRPSLSQQGHPAGPPLLEKPSAKIEDLQHELGRAASGTNLSITTPMDSIHSADSAGSQSAPGLDKVMSNSTVNQEDDSFDTFAPRIPPQAVRKKSSTSNLRPKNLSLATNDLNELLPTPGSARFPSHSRSGTLSTPVVPNASPSILTSTVVGGLYLFDHVADRVAVASPRSQTYSTEPAPLEPCPESTLLRPFWLMRCLYQTLSHPRGGYLSMKLFVPREIWRVKGIKLKAVEDKTGQCDILTAALQKLAKVDTLDADAVLEELQSLESIIDTVRSNLSKKLGNDVGLSGGAVAAIKSSQPEDPDATKSATSMKSLASSWKKLRSKSSAPALAPSRKDSTVDYNISSLPMTTNSDVATSRSYRSQRYPPPTPSDMPQVPALHASYVSSLARLFDAVQVLDGLARQVEDPGLKATSKTQVGLEFSMKLVVDFFSFYILRFVLADIGIVMDKYLKRNTEWIMA